MQTDNKVSGMVKRVLNAYYPPEEFYIFITYAPLGYGKSAYDFKAAVKLLKRVYHLSEEEAWEKLKQFITFHPTQFFTKIEEIELSGLKRIPFVIWEDMGLWLYAMDWNNPFMEAFIKYLNVARTHLASIIGSTPSPEWVLRKLRRFPSCFTVRVQKPYKDNDYTHQTAWMRKAVGYRFWLHADLRHSGVKRLWEDDFHCRMPDKFFEWYKPLRDTYEDMALALLREKWQRISQQSKALLLDAYPNLKLPSLEAF